MFFSETPFLRRACYLSIAGAFIFLAIVFVVRFLASDPPRPAPSAIKERTSPSHRRVDRTTPAVLEVSEAYYRTIIENNLFRPLDWTPPRPVEPYRLIGTILPRDENTPPKAIIETTAGQKTYSVTIGDKIETHTEVVDIQPKQGTLSTDGKQRTLKLPIRF